MIYYKEGDGRRLAVLLGMTGAMVFVVPLLIGWGISIAVSLCRDVTSAFKSRARRDK